MLGTRVPAPLLQPYRYRDMSGACTERCISNGVYLDILAKRKSSSSHQRILVVKSVLSCKAIYGVLAGCKIALSVLCVSLSGSPRVQSRTPGSLYHGRLYVVIERRPCRPAGAQARRVLFAYVYCENQTPWQGEEIFLWSQTPPLPPPHTVAHCN